MVAYTGTKRMRQNNRGFVAFDVENGTFGGGLSGAAAGAGGTVLSTIGRGLVAAAPIMSLDQVYNFGFVYCAKKFALDVAF